MAKRGAALPVLALALAAGVAQAQEADDPGACARFDWPLMREQAWFAAAGLPRLESGATLPEEMPGATLALKPEADMHYPVPPSKAPGPGSYGGIMRLPALSRPGLYQVTLSDEAWIDVSQDGATARPPVAHTATRGCPGLRKSVRFQFGTSPILIEVSGARGDTIRIAVAPAE